MKKSLIAAAAVAAVGISAYLGFRPDPASTLTELQLANAEALSDPETWVGHGYAKSCVSDSYDICARGPYEVFVDAIPYEFQD